MAKVLITESILQNTADSIRSVKGTQGGITPSEFPSEIASMGGKYKPKYLSFAYKTIDDATDFEDYLETLDTSEITDFSCCFRTLTRNGLTKMTLTINIDTSSATTMNQMFSNTESVTAYDISSFNFENCLSLQSMFYQLSYLQQITFPTETQYVNVSEMGNMFAYNTRYNGYIDLNFFNNLSNPNLTSINNLCSGNQNLTCFKMANMKLKTTGASKHLGSAFQNCYALEEIHIDNLNLDIVTASYANSMFDKCGYYLPSGTYTKVYVKDTNVRDWILNNATTLKVPSGWSSSNIIIAGSADDHRND